MRLFIADADSTFRLAAQMYLQQEPGLYVSGMATESQGLAIQLTASRPDVLLLDWHLPNLSTQDLFSAILALESPPKIVAVSVKSEDREPALSAGAYAFIDKKELPAELIKVVRSLMKTIDSPKG